MHLSERYLLLIYPVSYDHVLLLVWTQLHLVLLTWGRLGSIHKWAA